MIIQSFNTAQKTFIIAELSANHNQSFETAVASIKAIKQTGANAVKLQTYTADTITLNSQKDYFKIQHGSLWDGTTLYELYKQAYTPWEWHADLMKIAQNEGLICFSSPFDTTAVDFLEDLHVPAYKIASFEIHDIPLIEYTASKGKPIILSIGIATEPEIEEAVAACKRVGNSNIALLKCTSSYPAPVHEANLLTIPDIAKRFGVTAGLSDHTMGTAVSVAAVALGAQIIEKHFIIDRNMGGPDAAFSMNQAEFTEMVQQIRIVEQARGKVTYELTEKSVQSRWAARSLFVCEDMKAGQIITEQTIRSIRPGHGLHPRHLPEIIGKPMTKDVEKGTPFSWDMISLPANS